MQVRRAVNRDCETIARLAAAAAHEEGVVAALDMDRLRAHAFANNPLIEVWVARAAPNGPIVGQAVIAKSYDVRRASPSLTLCQLYVVPEQRRSGCARNLMSAIAQRARDVGARELVITTGVENEVAQRFFAAVGAKRQEAAVFMMSADGIEWLAAEGL